MVATSAELTKAECRKMAAVAHDGLARAIRPVHSMFDGDTIFCLSTARHVIAATEAPGLRRTDTRAGIVNTLLAAAADCFALACTRPWSRRHRSVALRATPTCARAPSGPEVTGAPFRPRSFWNRFRGR